MAQTGRNRTGPTRSVGRPTAHAPGGRPACRQRYRRRQTTDTSEQNNTGSLGGPVMSILLSASAPSLSLQVIAICMCISDGESKALNEVVDFVQSLLNVLSAHSRPIS